MTLRTFRIHCAATVALAALLLCRPALAQQRPLVTEDPETIGAGRLLIEGGLDLARDQTFPASGLTGDLLRFPLFGVSIGLSSIAELQIDGGLFNRLNVTKRAPAPLSRLLTFTGDRTHDIEDLSIGTKIRIVAETATHPSFGLRLVTRLPNASNESGLGLDTTDFSAVVLVAKTIQSVRIVGNGGIGILGDPTEGHRQNDVLVYGASFARALTERAEIVGELNGRVSTRSSAPFPGTETRGRLNVGSRYTRGPVRLDAAIFVGLTSIDPKVGFATGFTYVFHAFDVP